MPTLLRRLARVVSASRGAAIPPLALRREGKPVSLRLPPIGFRRIAAAPRRWTLAALVLGCVLALVADPGAAQEQGRFVIGYLEGPDPYYDEWGQHPADMGVLDVFPPGRPFGGAEVGILEARPLRRVIDREVALERREGESVEELVAALRELKEAEDARVFLVDARADVVAELASATRDEGVILFNVSADDNALRGELCQPHLFHTIPSEAMLMDALVQFLVTQRWTDILVLQGPLPEDEEAVESLRRAAERFGASIVDVRPFLLSNDPRAREQNRVPLLTSGADYDVVFVADAHGEFAWGVPYQTQQPRPVVGAEGLTPTAWHWSFLRYGAPQLNSRFERANHRRMGPRDWAAWMAVKAIVQGLLRTRSTDVGELEAYLKDPELRLDGFKGGGFSFRPWDNQFRQRILLATDEWVPAIAPFDAFLHPTNNLDTLGVDEQESSCDF